MIQELIPQRYQAEGGNYSNLAYKMMRTLMEEHNQHRYDHIYRSQVTLLPKIKAVDTLYYTEENMTLYDNEQTSPFRHKDDMLMVFHLRGNMSSYFGGISKPFHYTPKSWSFFYAPQENIHPADAGQWLETLVLGIDKSFFTDLIAHGPDPWIENILNQIEQGRPFNLVPDSSRLSPRTEYLLQRFRTSPLTGSLKTLQQQSRVLDIMTDQLSYLKAISDPKAVTSRLSPLDQGKLYELKDFLEQSFLQDHSLDGLARMSGLNTFKLKTGFRELFSVSVFENIRQLRMKYAEEQLSSGLTVSEVAYQLGYEHVQHFSAAFKKHHGHSPKYFKAL